MFEHPKVRRRRETEQGNRLLNPSILRRGFVHEEEEEEEDHESSDSSSEDSMIGTSDVSDGEEK